MPTLFDPLPLRDLTLRNRIGVSPMCMYACEARDGLATPFHVAHLGARALGGAGLVFSEATAVTAEGRISPEDLGLWSDAHAAALRPVVDAVHAGGAAMGIQLAHAGRKASTYRPYGAPRRGVVPADEGGWTPVGPSDVPFRDGDPAPRAADAGDLARIVQGFADAAARADAIGVDVIEVHAAHGYLLHAFLSPLGNPRTDAWGGDWAGRTRLVKEVVTAVRAVWPAGKPLFVRLSAVDGAEGGWTVEDSVRLAADLAPLGADVIDASGGGVRPGARPDVGPGGQVPWAEAIRRGADVASAAVGGLHDPALAASVVAEGRADLVLVGKGMLRDAFWAHHAAEALGVAAPWPEAYGWAVAPEG